MPSDDSASTSTDADFMTWAAVVSGSKTTAAVPSVFSPVGGIGLMSVTDAVEDINAIDWRSSCQRVLAGARAGRAPAPLATVGTGLLLALPADVPLRSVLGAEAAAAPLRGAPGARGKSAFSVQVKEGMNVAIKFKSLTCSLRQHVTCHLASFGVEVHGHAAGTAHRPHAPHADGGQRDGRVGYEWYMHGHSGGDETAIWRPRRVREPAASSGRLQKRKRL